MAQKTGAQKHVDSGHAVESVESVSEFIVRLKPAVQKYAWGNIGKDSLVAQYAACSQNAAHGISTGHEEALKDIENDAPYAELWMGTHPNGQSGLLPLTVVGDSSKAHESKAEGAPEAVDANAEAADANAEAVAVAGDSAHDSNADTNGKIVSLGEKMPKYETLKAWLDDKHIEMPYLLKVLSIKAPLSLQLHPDLTNATELHAKYPEIYKDPFDKPEAAMALSSTFEAFCGFQRVKDILLYAGALPPFNAIASLESTKNVVPVIDTTEAKPSTDSKPSNDPKPSNESEPKDVEEGKEKAKTADEIKSGIKAEAAQTKCVPLSDGDYLRKLMKNLHALTEDKIKELCEAVMAIDAEEVEARMKALDAEHESASHGPLGRRFTLSSMVKTVKTSILRLDSSSHTSSGGKGSGHSHQAGNGVGCIGYKAGKEERVLAALSLFKRLHPFFPNDRGLFACFFLNYVKLSAGECIGLGPNVIHAYISGDCLECMKNSDNVIRAGLTPKFQDVENLLRLTQYSVLSPKDAVIRPSDVSHFASKRGCLQTLSPPFTNSFRFRIATLPAGAITDDVFGKHAIKASLRPITLLVLKGSGLLKITCTPKGGSAVKPAGKNSKSEGEVGGEGETTNTDAKAVDEQDTDQDHVTCKDESAEEEEEEEEEESKKDADSDETEATKHEEGGETEGGEKGKRESDKSGASKAKETKEGGSKSSGANALMRKLTAVHGSSPLRAVIKSANRSSSPTKTVAKPAVHKVLLYPGQSFVLTHCSRIGLENVSIAAPKEKSHSKEMKDQEEEKPKDKKEESRTNLPIISAQDFASPELVWGSDLVVAFATPNI